MSNVQTGCMSACEGFEALEERIEQQDQELAAMRAAILALAAELDGQAIPQMGPATIAKRLRDIAGKEPK